jgi:hypothetical protein
MSSCSQLLKVHSIALLLPLVSAYVSRQRRKGKQGCFGSVSDYQFRPCVLIVPAELEVF